MIRGLVPDRVSARLRADRRLAFTFTPRALRLLAAGLVFVLPAALDRRMLLLMAAWDAAVIVAWLIDLRALPPPEALTVSRGWTAAPGLGVPQQIRVSVSNASDRPVVVWATDLPHPLLRAVPCELLIDLPAQGTASAGYDVAPVSRGDLEMGNTAVRYRGALGLAERWGTAHLGQTVRVYPDIASSTRESLALIRARQMAIERRRARMFGFGRDFESLREFQQGDELRDVCWTASARRGKLIARTYRPERSQTVWVVVDTGRLMRARDGGRTRLDTAVSAAFALARVATAAGDRVGVLTYGRGTPQRVAPGRGSAHLRNVLDTLATAQSTAAEADHARAAGAIKTVQKRRALIVWLTDVAETTAVPEVIESAARLVPEHVLLFAVARPRELTELAAREPADTRELFRVVAAQEMVERRARLLGDLREHGALAVEVASPNLAATVVDRYLGVKERNLL
jgi:uncharacterized protein (DUF58 family)